MSCFTFPPKNLDLSQISTQKSGSCSNFDPTKSGTSRPFQILSALEFLVDNFSGMHCWNIAANRAFRK